VADTKLTTTLIVVPSGVYSLTQNCCRKNKWREMQLCLIPWAGAEERRTGKKVGCAHKPAESLHLTAVLLRALGQGNFSGQTGF